MAARHLSFAEAASQSNLTQSAASHRIRGLEEELGFRPVQAPDASARTHFARPGVGARLGNAIGEIDGSIIEVERADNSALLKVTMLPVVASHWLIPRLPESIAATRISTCR